MLKHLEDNRPHEPDRKPHKHLMNVNHPVVSELSVADVERRILRACQTIRALPDKERKFQVLPNLWPEVVQDVADAYGYTDAKLPRFNPTPFDVSDCLTALAWARGLPRRDFKLIWWKSFDISHHQIGLRLGRTAETARRRYHNAILEIWVQACKAVDNNVGNVPHPQTKRCT